MTHPLKVEFILATLAQTTQQRWPRVNRRQHRRISSFVQPQKKKREKTFARIVQPEQIFLSIIFFE